MPEGHILHSANGECHASDADNKPYSSLELTYNMRRGTRIFQSECSPRTQESASPEARARAVWQTGVVEGGVTLPGDGLAGKPWLGAPHRISIIFTEANHDRVLDCVPAQAVCVNPVLVVGQQRVVNDELAAAMQADADLQGQ